MKIGRLKLAWPSPPFLLIVGFLLGLTANHLLFGFNFTKRHLDYVQKVTEKAAAKKLDEAIEANDALWKRRLIDSRTLELDEETGTYRRPQERTVPSRKQDRSFLWS